MFIKMQQHSINVKNRKMYIKQLQILFVKNYFSKKKRKTKEPIHYLKKKKSNKSSKIFDEL